MIGILVFAGLLFAFNNVTFLNEMLEKVSVRQTYLFENRSLIDYLTSGRTWMLAEATNLFIASNNPLGFLIGNGYYRFHHDLAVSSGYLLTANVRPIEFDWADLLFSLWGPLPLSVYMPFCLNSCVCLGEQETKDIFNL